MEKKNALCVVLALLATVVSADTARNAAARAELVKGVAAIDCNDALPGPFVCLTDDAFNVIAAKNYDGTIHPVVVGAFYGEGRVVALGHPNFLCQRATKADTAQFLRNMAGWLAGGRPGKVAVVRNAALLDNLTSCGIAAEKVESFDAAFSHPAVAFMSGDVSVADYPKVRDYVKSGGGIVTDALTWGWAYFAERNTGLVSPSLHYDVEKLLASFGFIAGDAGVNRSGSKGFETGVAFPFGTTLPEAMKAVRDGSAEANATVRAQVTKTLVQAANACPPGAGAAFDALAALADEPTAQKRPTPEQPLTAKDYLARVAVVLRQNAWQQNPVRLWPADPAAAVYPGLVKEGAKTVKDERVSVDMTASRWKSTGLFAGAGQPITVRLPGKGTEKLGLKLRVGTTGDDNTSCGEWKRAPLVTVTIPLDRREMTFSTPFGGLLYVVVPEGGKGTAEVEFSGAVRAPHFVLGRDTNADWRRMLAECVAPQAEIEGRHYVITVFSNRAGECDDPEWIATFWDKVVEVDSRLTGLPAPRDYKERICADIQLRAGWLHDGYPMMYHSLARNPEDILIRRKIEKTGEWGVQHELGHNFQNRDWTFEGTGEVTVNLFTLYSAEMAAGLADREIFADYTSRAACKRRVVRWVEDGKSFDDWKKDYFLALDTFMRIQRTFGWEPFLTMFREYRAPVVGKLPTNNQERIDQWATRLSRILNRNFADYFAAWSWPLSKEAVAECAKYPKFTAEESKPLYEYMEGLPDDSVVGITITPKEGAIANVGGWTSFVFSSEPEARSRAMSNGLKCTGKYRLRISITDETDGQSRTFDYPIRDMNKDMWPVTRIAPIPYGLTPRRDHAYTVKMTVLEGDRVRFEGTSEKGAFVSTDPSFLLDGPIHFAPDVKVRGATPLKGRSVLFVGDSITEAICEVNNPHLRYTAGWPGRVGWANGMRWLNTGISGATVSDNWGPGNTVRRQVGWHKGMPFDIVIAHGGINDAMGKCPAGTVAPGKPEDYNPSAEDFKTFAGSLEYLFWQIRHEIPGAKVGYIINFRVEKSGWSDWAKMPEYLPLMKKACEKWGIPYINLWEDESVAAQIKPETRTALGDSLHPNNLGYDILYPYIEQFVEAVWTGAAKPGVEFKAKPVVTAKPVAAVIGPDDVNVAAGKMCRSGDGWSDRMTDGKTEGYILTGNTTTFADVAKSDCYQEIDLGALYTIDKIRVFPFVSNGVAYWAAYATDDAAKPLHQWKLLCHKTDQRMSGGDGYAVKFPETDARFVRIYGLHELGQSNALFIEAEVYGKVSAKNTFPLEEAKVPEGLVDLAKGKHRTNPGMVWCADGETECRESLGTASDCYVEVDLGGLCEISALRARATWGIRCHWAAYATDDATKPIGDWTSLGGKLSVYKGDEKGYTIGFSPVKARYVRVYGLRAWKRSTLQMEAPEVYGRELDAPRSPAHSPRVKPDWRWDATSHYVECTDANCRERVRVGRHVYGAPTMTKRPEGGKPGELVRKCLFCDYQPIERGIDGRGRVNVALGCPATFPDGRPAAWITDGVRAYTASWSGYVDDPTPLGKLTDDSRCFFEIDLGSAHELTAANLVDDFKNTRNAFAVFVAQDRTLPIAEWTLAARREDGPIAREEGIALDFAKPVVGRYVRVYGLRCNLGIGELAVYGKPVDAPAPVPRHAIPTNFTFNAEQHWFACTNAGCSFTRLHAKHRFGGMTLKALPTATADGEKFRDCGDCAFRERTPLPANPALGEVVSLGKSARLGIGKVTKALTDGDFRNGEWTTKEARAQATVDDADKCYFEIDLERSVPVTAITYMAFENCVKFAAYGTDDAAKPIAQWKKLGEKTDGANFPMEGWTLPCDGTPVRYVRLYGLEYGDQNGIFAREITVYGRNKN